MHATKCGLRGGFGRRPGLILPAGLILALAGLVVACGGSANDEASASSARAVADASVAATTLTTPTAEQPADLPEDVAAPAAQAQGTPIDVGSTTAVREAATGDVPGKPDSEGADSGPAAAIDSEAIEGVSDEAGAAGADGTTTATVDARDATTWTFFSFTDGTVVTGAFTSADWDLAFQRTSLLTNSGVTNAAGPGGALDLGEIGFAEASLSAEAEFVVDALDGGDGGDPDNAAISGWYVYHFADHSVTAEPNLFAVRTHSGQIALVRFESYYCGDGSPGCVTFRYRLDAPEP